MVCHLLPFAKVGQSSPEKLIATQNLGLVIKKQSFCGPQIHLLTHSALDHIKMHSDTIVLD